MGHWIVNLRNLSQLARLGDLDTILQSQDEVLEGLNWTSFLIFTSSVPIEEEFWRFYVSQETLVSQPFFHQSKSVSRVETVDLNNSTLHLFSWARTGVYVPVGWNHFNALPAEIVLNLEVLVQARKDIPKRGSSVYIICGSIIGKLKQFWNPPGLPLCLHSASLVNNINTFLSERFSLRR